MKEEDGQVEENSWKSMRGYVLSVMGSAVGFANILSFSAQCYRNGGGAFFLPFFLAMVLIGFPMLLLEALVGQRLRCSLVSAYQCMGGKRGGFWGWLSTLTCACVGSFYIPLTGFSLAYLYFVLAGKIGADSALFFKEEFLCDSGSLMRWGELSYPILFSTLLVLLFSHAVLGRGIRRGVERFSSLFLPLLTLIISFCALFGLFIPGGLMGIGHYLRPDFSLLKSAELWRDACGHVFFSLSLSFGIITGYSRYNAASISLKRAMFWVLTGDLCISVISGAAIFSCVGYLSVTSGVPFDQIVQSASIFEMGFIIFPALFSQLPSILSLVVAPLFFFSIFIAGITGVFSILEAVVGNVEEVFGWSRKRSLRAVSLVMLVLSLPYCWGVGQHILAALSSMVLGNMVLIGGLSEILLFLYVSPLLKQDVIWFRGGRRSWFYLFLKIPIPLSLSYVLINSIWREWNQASLSASFLLRWGWLGLVLVCSYFLSSRESVVWRKRSG